MRGFLETCPHRAVHVKKQAHRRTVAVWSPDNLTRDCGELAYRQDSKGIDMANFSAIIFTSSSDILLFSIFSGS